MKRYIANSVLFLVAIGLAAAQGMSLAGSGVRQVQTLTTPVSTSSTDSLFTTPKLPSLSEERAGLAMTSAEYPVTPGDVYALTYILSSGPASLSIIVDSNYILNLSNLGTVNARGMRFAELRVIVEKKASDAYTLSAPQLVIKSCGLFPVYLQGEVKQSSTLYLWGLSRLAELWDDVTPYASSRDVSLRSNDGSVHSYDLFKAWRYGDLSQDPILRPYDTVIFTKYARSVNIAGEVRRPGIYQLLPGERLKELVESYGDGWSPKADPSRLVLVRLVESSGGIGETRVVNYLTNTNLELDNADSISVPPIQDLLPVVYFEGAIGVGVNGAALQASQRIPYTFYPGETLSQAAQKMRVQFTAVSDLVNAYIIRGTAKIPKDLSKFLYSKDFSSDISKHSLSPRGW